MPEAGALALPQKRIEEARPRVYEAAWPTPLVPYPEAEDVHLKLECLQRLGSFKIRGAWNRMSRVDEAARKRGFVTISAGNHGRAVAWIAKRLGAPATVYVPEGAVARKVEAMEALGATVVARPHGEIMEMMTDDRLEEQEAVYVHPFGHPDTVAGQGTIGLEIHEALPEARTVLVPVGGGGLSLGIATALHHVSRKARVYGVQAEGAAPLARSFETGAAERLPHAKTIADGIAASYVFDYMWPRLQERLAGCLTVTDDGILRAMALLARESHVVAEPAGAASVAAAIAGPDLPRPVVCVVSGGNVDPALFAEVIGA